MSGEDYNIAAIKSGAVSPRMLREMVRLAQGELGVHQDGLCGPETCTALLVELARTDSLAVTPSLALRALAFAAAEIGNGETEGNNLGPAITKYRSYDPRRGPADGSPWCADFQSWCLYQANRCRPLPFALSGSAEELGKAMLKAGARKIDVPVPGAYLFWNRGAVVSWRKHVGICERYSKDGTGDLLTTIEGNRDIPKTKDTAKVNRFGYPGGIWRQHLWLCLELPEEFTSH